VIVDPHNSRVGPRRYVDLYCGAGGSTTGWFRAALEADLHAETHAFNHWDRAIETHTVNHPDTNHRIAAVQEVCPRSVAPGGRSRRYVNCLWLSPECVYHSRARGGGKCNPQSRAGCDVVFNWTDLVDVDRILLENVIEFEQWKDLDDAHNLSWEIDGKQVFGRKRPYAASTLTRIWRKMCQTWPYEHLMRFRYRFWENGVDVGAYLPDPEDEEVQARTLPSTGKGVPDPNLPDGQRFKQFVAKLRDRGYQVEWRRLDAADHGAATNRIRLFLQAARNGRPILWPTPTHNEHGTDGLQRWRGAVEHIDWERSREKSRSIFNRPRPMSVKTLRRIWRGLCRTWPSELLHQFYPKFEALGTPDMDKWMPKEGEERHVVDSFFVHYRGTGADRSIYRPHGSICAGGKHYGLIQPVAINYRGESLDWALGGPAPTMTGKRHLAVIEPQLVAVNHGDSGGDRVRSIHRPHPAITSKRGIAVVEPTIMPIDNGSATSAACRSTTKPVTTIVQKQRHALVEPLFETEAGDHVAVVDIVLRMLSNEELKVLQGFDPDYELRGNEEEKTKQIGNSVSPYAGYALLSPYTRNHGEHL
jgi:DNA (cytosine-5)-methyltransferase 1